MNSEGRKSKEVCKKLLNATLNNNSDSDDYQESEYDSDVDPEFKYSEDSEEVEDGNESSKTEDNDNEDSDDSNFSDENLAKLFDNEIIPSRKCEIDGIEDAQDKQISKRKISEECLGIYGLAQKYLWDGKYNEALEQCEIIRQAYPTFWGTYDILAQIYDALDDRKKANQLYYTAAMCNPKDTDKWIACIDYTKQVEGVKKAIEITKLALTRTNNIQIREEYVRLLEEGGYKKEALKKKLANIEAAPLESDPDAVDEIVTNLFYMSEVFESMHDFKRSAKCLEILDAKYPEFLNDKHRVNLLKSMVTVRRFTSVFSVAGKIRGVIVDLDSPDSLLSFNNDEIAIDYRRQVIIAAVFAAIHSKMTSFITHESFVRYIQDLVELRDEYLAIVNELFDLKHWQLVLDLTRYLADRTDDKLAPLKMFGKSQEALGMDEAALHTYDYIINKINEQDASVWELKANLLYRMQREEDAIQVLAESQRFIHEYRPNKNYFDRLPNRCKPTKESLQLLYKLCRLLFNENRFDDFIKVAWKFLFIDSVDYFDVNRIEMSCEDISSVKPRICDIQNNVWLCISKTIDSNGHCLFQSSHSRTSDDSTWNILHDLLELLAESFEQNADLVELLAQWGLVLHKILNWNNHRRWQLSALYVSTALRNRLHNHRLRLEISTNMIFQELRTLRNNYGERNQFWNLFQIYAIVSDVGNNRFILRNMSQIKNLFPLEVINAGSTLTGSAKLSLTINNKLFFQHRANAQISLHMAITLVNASLSRNCREMLKPLELAVGFINEYRRTRGDCQETFYNMGRFFHRINFENYAIAYYEKCLSLPAIGSSAQERSLTDLSKEAAFNLVYIYKGRNNKCMVAYLTEKYLVI